MNPGKLRHRVEIRHYDYIRDSHGDIYRDPVTGEMTKEWQCWAEVWAAVEPLRGREFFASAATQYEVSTRIRIRYRPGLTPDMRVLHNDDLYTIEAIIEPEMRHEELQIMCKRSVL